MNVLDLQQGRMDALREETVPISLSYISGSIPCYELMKDPKTSNAPTAVPYPRSSAHAPHQLICSKGRHWTLFPICVQSQDVSGSQARYPLPMFASHC